MRSPSNCIKCKYKKTYQVSQKKREKERKKHVENLLVDVKNRAHRLLSDPAPSICPSLDDRVALGPHENAVPPPRPYKLRSDSRKKTFIERLTRAIVKSAPLHRY